MLDTMTRALAPCAWRMTLLIAASIPFSLLITVGILYFTGASLNLLSLMGLMLARSFRPGNYDAGSVGVTAVSLFWHFVDVIWVVLFVLIYVWQR